MPTDGFRRTARKLRKMGDEMEEAGGRAAGNASASIVAQMKETVVAQDAVASTELFRGIGYHRVMGHIRIYSDAPHSGYVEFGTGPRHVFNPYTRKYGTPSFSSRLVGALARWAALKPSVAWIDPMGAAMKISGNTEEPGGTDPKPFFVPTWESNRSLLVREVRVAASRKASF